MPHRAHSNLKDNYGTKSIETKIYSCYCMKIFTYSHKTNYFGEVLQRRHFRVSLAKTLAADTLSY